MTNEESEILTFLRSWPKDYFSAKEIGRRVGRKKKFREFPLWAKPYLRDLLRKELVETDDMGHFRFRFEKPKQKGRRFLSPQIRAILQKSGRQFGEEIVLDVTDDFEQL